MANGMELHSAKIVIVDDEPANVLLLKRILEKDGYTDLVSVTRSDELLDSDTLTGADLLLLDLHMPPPDGFAILEALQRTEMREFLPILVLTADTTAPSRIRALDYGANDYVTKPFDTVEVLLRVRNLLELRFLHRQLLKTNRLLQDRLLELEGPK